MISLDWCMLDTLLSGLINATGGNLSSYIDFDYQSLYCWLSYRHDIICLKSYQNRLSNHLINWFQVWYNPQVTDIKYNFMNPYTLHVFVGCMRSSRIDGNDSFTTYCEEVEDECSWSWRFFVPYYDKIIGVFWSCLRSIFYTMILWGLPSCMMTSIFVFIWRRCGLLGMDFATGPRHLKIVRIEKFGKIV